MITLSADWLRERWSEVITADGLALPLSSWDSGDAFTFVHLGPLPATEQVAGRILLSGHAASFAPVTVELAPVESASGTDAFDAPDGRRYRATGWRQEEGKLRKLPVAIVDVANVLAERRTALLETALLSDAAVAVVGLGTGGIHIALELAKAGVGRFALVDADRLGVGNVARHHAGISHAGRLKVYAARDFLLEKNPAARVDCYPVAAGPQTEDLIRRLAEENDLLICATDGRPSKLFVNRVAVATGRPAVFGGAFRRAFGGQVLRVRPGESPCYQCFVMGMPEAADDQEIGSVTEAAEVAYSDRPVPIEPGLSLDVAPIALMVARLALQELVTGRSSTLSVLDRDLAAPWYLWINRPEPDTQYSDWPPLSESSDEMTVLRWYGIHLDREPSCPACGDFSAAAMRDYGIVGGLPIDLPSPPTGTVLPSED